MIKNWDDAGDAMEDYLDQPFKFYEAIFAGSGLRRPAKRLADILGLSESSVHKWARPRESDEAPYSTGSRSDAERFIQTMRDFALRGDESSLQACEDLLDALRAELRAEYKRREAFYRGKAEQREPALVFAGGREK